MSAVVGETLWKGPASDAQLVYTVDQPDGAGIFATVATRDRGDHVEILSLGLPNPLAVGTYPIDGAQVFAGWSDCFSGRIGGCIGYNATGEDPGSLTITAIDEEADIVTGTFHFTGHLAAGDEEIPATKGVALGQFVIHVPGLGDPVESARTH